MFLEQSARHLRRLRHHLDGVEQRERTDVEARRGRFLLAFLPPLEDRAELLVVTNDDSVTGLAQRAMPSGSSTCDDSSMMIQSSSASSARLFRIEKHVDATTG